MIDMIFIVLCVILFSRLDNDKLSKNQRIVLAFIAFLFMIYSIYKLFYVIAEHRCTTDIHYLNTTYCGNWGF